jgi:predicted DNA-binding transcriptional regulator AlpA
MRNNHIEESYITAFELSKKLNIPLSTIYYWATTYQDFPSIKFGRCRRFKLSEVIDYFKKKESDLILDIQF